VQKLWSLVFLFVPIFSVAIFIIAPSYGWWLPENICTFGGDVDYLFKLILVIVTIAFIGTQTLLVYALFRWASHGGKSTFIHTHHWLEVGWTIVPAVILVFIAFYQFDTWIRIKSQKSFPKQTPDAEVLAGQFECVFAIPAPTERLGRSTTS